VVSWARANEPGTTEKARRRAKTKEIGGSRVDRDSPSDAVSNLEEPLGHKDDVFGSQFHVGIVLW
jgi:hypothetical protein